MQMCNLCRRINLSAEHLAVFTWQLIRRHNLLFMCVSVYAIHFHNGTFGFLKASIMSVFFKQRQRRKTPRFV
jgi:hypothetical protein